MILPNNNHATLLAAVAGGLMQYAKECHTYEEFAKRVCDITEAIEKEDLQRQSKKAREALADLVATDGGTPPSLL